MAYFTHRGCRLFYEEHGQGTPVLLIHGLGSSALDWELQIPALAAHYRVIALDVRGHGRSDKPRQRYRIADFADDAAALIDHLQLAPVHLVGISMGGMIGFQLGVDHPQLLRSLTVVNSAPEVKAKKPSDYLQIAKRWTLARVLSLDATARALARLLFPKPEQAELRRKVEERWPRNDKRAYLASLDAIIGWGVRERLALITCPTLVISADRDYTPIALKQAYVDELPDARLLVIKDSRHATPLDQPEHFNRSLLAFVREVENTAATSSKD
ncbi:alpha/beta fold hydrolase [Pseudomonas sp. PA27(2017)]|uniref:alpha/beta fold hydrolase n=1 Tax=Pseudomonas sp. PA27(2017) TaxID=1932112 RepID=UPI0009644633|nr:alpha/beta fold hydrolase [Pseudomonas sp. PA27(2017)]OLU32237.1 3-oxoadipate enol-lactonase [Pseudomonas sp. PA27(2017)]